MSLCGACGRRRAVVRVGAQRLDWRWPMGAGLLMCDPCWQALWGRFADWLEERGEFDVLPLGDLQVMS